MRIDILSAVPALLQGPLDHSILGRARQRGLLEVHVHDLRRWSADPKHGQIDDYAYGGGAGMVLQIGPVHRALDALRSERDYDEVIYLSPDGELLDQPMANRLSLGGHLILLCGHYKGIDERIREHLVTREVSIGDYVLSGGELAAAVLVDCVGRLIPGVLNDETSALSDSFQDGLIAPPVYTRPAAYGEWRVPEVLLSGDHIRIEAWRLEQARARTRERRPGLLEDDADEGQNPQRPG
jgi:tRNA (guanine37-N1)-methyltransferase